MVRPETGRAVGRWAKPPNRGRNFCRRCPCGDDLKQTRKVATVQNTGLDRLAGEGWSPLMSRAAAGSSGLTEIFMSASRLHWGCGVAAVVALALAACTSNSPPLEQAAAPASMTQPAIPSQYRPEEVVGRWGYGAFHNESDLARTSAAARGQCGQPVEITRGANGGVM